MAGRAQHTYLTIAQNSTSSVVATALANAGVVLYSLSAMAANTATPFSLNNGNENFAGALFTTSSGVPIILGHNEFGWVETSQGSALTVTTTTGSSINFIAVWKQTA